MTSPVAILNCVFLVDWAGLDLVGYDLSLELQALLLP
jgi:hypothetical protein